MKMPSPRRKAGREPIGKTQEVAPAFDIDDRLERIAIAAYFKAEARGFVPGREIDDWLLAEREIGEPEED